MYDANKNNNMWPQHQQQFMGPIPPHHNQCRQTTSSSSSSSSSSSLHRLDAHAVPNRRLDNHIPQQHPHQHHGVMEIPVPSNPRASRNMAEKQRRDNLNANISTMAALVPAVAGSSRRMDKISILRLAAAFLRSQYTLGPGPESFLPRHFDFDLEQYVIENLVANAGFFLVVTTTGKIVYVSRYIEHQLGHAQHELLGQSLYNFVCSEDCEELQRNLTPDDVQTSTTNAVSRVGEDDSNSSEDTASNRSERTFTAQRRSFNIRMLQKALNKREHGQYECLQITGQLRLANACSNQAANTGRPRPREINSTSNDIIFVGIARLVKKRTITELSLLEATKDEYVTRHLVDGRIIFCDHRISVVAGYMTEEVSGLSAFKFMHKEDVRWTMIALRQMYDRGEEFGSSCYRLLSKTGQFIYLRTHGYLEFDKNTQTVESFVCVNTLVSEKEGMKLVKEMKERFSAVISGPAKAMITPSSTAPLMAPDAQRVDQKATVEDAFQLEDAINHLISDLPSPSVSDERQSPSPLPNNQYLKAAIYSQGLPPAVIQANKIGIKSINCKSPPDNRTSHDNIERHQRRNSIVNNEVSMPCSETLRNNNNTSIAGPSSGSSFAKSVEKMGLELSRASPANEKPEYSRQIVYVKNETARSNPSLFEASNNLQEKRTHRKRISQSIQEKERRGSKQLGNKNISAEQRMDLRVTSSCEIVRIRERVTTPRVSPVENNIVKDITTNETIARYNARKRSRNSEEPTGILSKRKATDLSQDFSSNEEQSDGDIVYYDNSDSPNITGFLTSSPISSVDDLGLGDIASGIDIDHNDDERQQRAACGVSMDLGAGISRLEPIQDYHQCINPAQALLEPSNSARGIDDELDEDLREGIPIPSLDADPDLRKTFEDLHTVIICNGKTIDEANVNQFTASDQAVNEGIRRSQFQLEKSIALRESQLSVLKRDLDNPALLAQRENFTQLEAEHNKQKQMLKTLQQDHLTLQSNVQHNVGV